MVEDEINFGGIIPQQEEQQQDFLDESIFGGGNFLRNPEVGKELIFTIEDIKNDDAHVMARTKEGKEFVAGFTDKNGKHKWDVICTIDGDKDKKYIYTVKAAEVFYALGKEIKKYSSTHPGLKPVWKGAKISIKHNYDGMHSNMKLDLLKAVLSVEPYNRKNLTDKDVEDYQTKVKEAKNNFKLYTVTLLN